MFVLLYLTVNLRMCIYLYLCICVMIDSVGYFFVKSNYAMMV